MEMTMFPWGYPAKEKSRVTKEVFYAGVLRKIYEKL
jgi:hypothetical protein